MREPKAIVALAIHPHPIDLSNLERTILLLEEAGGLVNASLENHKVNKFDGKITDL